MTINELRDRISDEIKTSWIRIQESTAYQQAMEKYEDLPTTQQRFVRVGSLVLILLFLLSPPISTILSSEEAIADFERKRDLTRELLRVVRDASNSPNIPAPPDSATLQTSIQEDLQNRKLLPEQIMSIQAGNDSGILIPPKLSSGSMNLVLKDLNLRQILDISYQLASMSPTLKMTDLELTSNAEKPGYFEFHTKMVALKMPDLLKISPESGTSQRHKMGKRLREDSDEGEESESPNKGHEE